MGRRVREAWTTERIRRLEELWADGLTAGEIAGIMGYASAKSLQVQIQKLRSNGEARLPKRYGRGSSKRSQVIEVGAAARNMSYAGLLNRLFAALDEGGTVLLDNVLDDGVTTPGADA